MSRQPRKLSETGFYHVVFRGVNHCHLFEENEDFMKLLEILMCLKKDLSLKVYAYCLMDNHVHLLIRENMSGDIIAAMRRLLSPYAYWFNNKYQRSGALIADRYKSECVESEEYLLVLVRYIHRNPVKAGIVSQIGSYRWSSYGEYIGQQKGLTDTGFILDVFSSDPKRALEEFELFHSIDDDDGYDDHSLPVSKRKSDQQIRLEISSVLAGLEPSAIGILARSERNALLASLRQQGFSIRQIERATGISRGIIYKCVS
jgi:REP element-mobilizing transposase RayT